MNLKKHKKSYLLTSIAVLAVLGIAGTLLWTPLQFRYYCKEKSVCACATQKLTRNEKKAFIKVAQYTEKNKTMEVDAKILKEISLDDMSEMGLKMKLCAAEVARQTMLNTLTVNRQKFPGNYSCMRQVLMHELSNEEVLFLNSVQSKQLDVIKNPDLRGMYLETSFKMMKCMPDDLQKQHQKEIKDNPPVPGKKVKPVKKGK